VSDCGTPEPAALFAATMERVWEACLSCGTGGSAFASATAGGRSTARFLVAHPEQDMSDEINLAHKLAMFTDHWSPRTVAQLNDYDVMCRNLDLT
jgi:hypothetical protein